MKIGILGMGAYAMALSNILNDNNCEITMWTKFEYERKNLELTRKNEKLIPNFLISEKIKLTTSIEECIKDNDLLIIAIPAAFVEELAIKMKPFINNDNILIVTKGILQNSNLFMNEIIEKHLNTENIAVLSGPTFAVDIPTNAPIALTLATNKKNLKLLIENAFSNEYTKIETITDIMGTELCGSIKNIFAIASGILAGLGCNESTKSFFMTKIVKDLEYLLEIFECDKKTILTYAGIGDLLLTCNSIKSRNYSFGYLLSTKKSQEDVKKYLKENTVEGEYTLKSILSILNQKNISIPIITVINDIIENKKEPDAILKVLVSE